MSLSPIIWKEWELIDPIAHILNSHISGKHRKVPCFLRQLGIAVFRGKKNMMEIRISNGCFPGRDFGRIFFTRLTEVQKTRNFNFNQPLGKKGDTLLPPGNYAIVTFFWDGYSK